MRTCLVGAHLDNRTDPPPSSYAKLRAMKARVVGTMWTPGTRHGRAVYERLETELDRPEYVVRVGPSGQTAPGAWLEDARALLVNLPFRIYSEGRVRLRVLNEVNLAEEGGWSPEGYAAFLRSVASVLSSPPLVAAPLSLGVPGWQEWYARFLLAAGGFYRSFPVESQAVNCYAHLADPANLAVFAASGVPLDVTELNTLSLVGVQRARWIADRARALAEAGARSVQVFIVGGKSHGAWDERYVLADAEAAELGRLTGGTIEVEETMLRGIDVSNNNGHVDFEKLAAGVLEDDQPAGPVDFVFAKASGDETSRHKFIDADFPYNWTETRRIGRTRGAYHYAKPSLVAPSTSVETFLESMERVGGFGPWDLAALDAEDPDVPVGVSLAVWCAEWGDLFERLTGFRAGLYTGTYYMDEHDLHVDEMKRRFGWLWLASYQPTRPPPPAPFDAIAVWQNGVLRGGVPGVAGPCDVNVFEGSLADLRMLGKPPGAGDHPLPPPGPVDEVTDALNNLFDVTLQSGAVPEERRRSAQRAIVVLKRRLGVT